MSIRQFFYIIVLTLCCSLAHALPSSSELLDSFKKNPGDNNLYFQYGIALSRENKDSEAIAVFEKLLTTYPQSSSLYNNLAVIYAKQKNFDKTEELLKNAIKYSPNYDTAYENIADLYAKLSALNYQRAYEINKNNALIPKIDNLNKVLDVAPGSFPVSSNTSSDVSVAKSDSKPGDNKVLLPVSLPSYSNNPKPVMMVAEASSISDSDSAEISSFIKSWQESWQNKDIQSYLSFYDSSFVSSNMNYSQWVQQRTKNISSQQNIRITLSDISIKLIDKQTHVTFIQSYKSKSVSSVDQVDYIVKKVNGQWKFIQKI